MWYGQKNYNDIQGINGRYRIADIGCFITAFCNLEQRFGKDISPSDLNKVFRDRGMYSDIDDGVRDDVGWSTITGYDGQIQVEQVGGASWPPHTNSIVKFAYKSPKTGAPMTHFCLVADPTNQTIVDSWDGQIRTPGYYGQPVAWATYKNVTPEPVVIPPVVAAPKSNATTGQAVILQKGDTISGIALRYGLQASEVLDHNGLSWDDARHLPIGYELRLPVTQQAKPVTSGYTIELVNPAKTYHVSRAGGATRWGFGNVRTWSDFVANGKTAENTNVEVHAIASVLVGKEPTAYYLDSLAVGDFATSGQLANTIGYNWSDLTEGAYEPPKSVEVAPPPVAPVEPTIAVPAPVQPVTVAEVAKPVVVTTSPPSDPNDPISPNHYKTTYKAWAKPLLYLVIKDGYAYELDGRRANKAIHRNQMVSIAGSFIKNNTLYARPDGAVKAGAFWGIPMDNLVSEAEVFNTAVSLPEKVAMRYAMSHKEKVVVLLSKLLTSFAKFKANLKNK